MANFKMVVDVEDDQFYLVAPDETESDWCDNDQVAVLEYNGTMHFATNCGAFPGMSAGKVYALGQSISTDVEDYEEDTDDDDDDADDADESEEEDVVDATVEEDDDED